MNATSDDGFELGSERDRLFFESRADRTYRVRAAVKGEFPDVPTPRNAWVMVAVWQVRPGIRARIPFVSNVFAPASEDNAREVYLALTAASPVAQRVQAIAADLAKQGQS